MTQLRLAPSLRLAIADCYKQIFYTVITNILSLKNTIQPSYKKSVLKYRGAKFDLSIAVKMGKLHAKCSSALGG